MYCLRVFPPNHPPIPSEDIVLDILARARMPSDDSRAWHAQWLDRCVRWKEKLHQEKSEGIPSPEAVDEAIEYYDGIHLGRPHDPVVFRRLLDRRGLPDWTNPYSSGPERSLVHEEGFLWADVQALVEHLMAKADGSIAAKDEDYHLRMHHAQICWMMILQETGGAWPRSLSMIHPDNLIAITLEAMLNPHLVLWGLDPGEWKRPDLLK